MSNPDTMTPLFSAPWRDADGKTLPVRALRGLTPELVHTLKSAYPGLLSPALETLLRRCSGLAETDIGQVDFTGCCFPEEPCGVFQPCLTMAIDDVGRRWIAEVRATDLPGPVWCVFSDPQVAVHISDDLCAFVTLLHDYAQQGQTLPWLQKLSAGAQAVWTHRRALALRPDCLDTEDVALQTWLAGLPSDAFVYDLRRQSVMRAWPYGVAGPAGRLYRFGRLPVFAAAGSPTEGWRAGPRVRNSPDYPIAALSLELACP